MIGLLFGNMNLEWKGRKMGEREKKSRTMSNAGFKGMMWLFKFTDFIHITNPRRRLDKAPLRERMVVVDYGCGPGRYTIPVAKLVGEEGKVFAVDIHPLAISVVKEMAARESLANIETILIDLYNTGIESSSVDMVFLIDTLHMIGDCDALFHEIHRLLKPTGYIFMDPGHMKLRKAREMVGSTGLFTIVKSWGNDMLVAPKAKNGVE